MPRLSEHELIGSLYDAALGHRSWDDVGPLLVRHIDGHTLMLSAHDPRTRAVDVVTTLGMSKQHLNEYGTFYAAHDVWALGALKLGVFDRAVPGTDAVEERALERSLIYNEFLHPKLNMHHLAGSLLRLEGGMRAVLGIHRPRDAKDYSPKDIRRLDLLLPHIRRALEIRHRLQRADQRSRSVYSALDRLSIGVILMSATGRLRHVNAAGDAILCSNDGLMRTPEGLRAGRKEDDKHLQELI
ncbi:unnamed protein product, partial [Phaeothamnion confervicola]